MAQLVPSILETTLEGFQNTYRQEIALSGVERLQIDFGDGVFIPNKILPVAEINVLNPAFHWEAHLMIDEPQDFLDYKICGFNTIIIHFEAFKNKDDISKAVNEIRTEGMEPALCISPDTEITVLKQFESIVRHFQIMGVYPGYQGTPFLDKTYDRVRDLRILIPNAIIEVDGGVGISNLHRLFTDGADLLILGASITKAPNMSEAWEKLKSEINKN